MCGITGFWQLAPLSPRTGQDLRAMLSTLHHRGPDGHGVHLDEKLGLALGHARLSIIGLDNGEQPIVAPDQSLALTANGELYDYKQVRAQGACEGETFLTKSDSEIALYAYRKRGLDFVNELRGEFAFAMFDQKAQRLILVRDRYGVKPLYMRVERDRIYWGSEVKAILAHPDVDRKLCSRAALHQMMQTMAPGTTAFEGIEAIEPGTMVIIQKRNDRFETKTIRYWDLEFPEANEYEDRPAQYWIDGVREQLIDAVRVRLEADVPVGCYLSGGIDSCSILGLAGPLQQSPIQAFTISFDHDEYDERAVAMEMAKKARAKQEILNLRAQDLYGEAFERTVWHAERTFYNTLAVAKWHMSKRVHECGYKVVLTGEGSDEIFGGYPFFKRDHLTQGTQDEASLQKLKQSNALFQGAILSERGVTHPAFESLCGFTPSWIQPWMLTLESVRPLFSRDVQSELQNYDPIESIAAKLDPKMLKGRTALDKAQYSWCKTMLEGQILTWGGDRVDMANSMESRPAFLDHKLAEFARKIPPKYRIHEGTEKWVLREAMRQVLPDLLYRREKFAFMAPPAFTDPSKQREILKLIDRYLNPEQIRAAGLFDEQAVSKYVERSRNESDRTQSTRDDIVINHLLQLHIMHDQFVAHRP